MKRLLRIEVLQSILFLLMRLVDFAMGELSVVKTLASFGVYLGLYLLYRLYLIREGLKE